MSSMSLLFLPVLITVLLCCCEVINSNHYKETNLEELESFKKKKREI